MCLPLPLHPTGPLDALLFYLQRIHVCLTPFSVYFTFRVSTSCSYGFSYGIRYIFCLPVSFIFSVRFGFQIRNQFILLHSFELLFDCVALLFGIYIQNMWNT